MPHLALSPFDVMIVEEVFKKDTGVQADMGSVITEKNLVDRQCRVCGVDYERDTKAAQNTWIGCESNDSKYWLHANCLLGTKKNVQTISLQVAISVTRT